MVTFSSWTLSVQCPKILLRRDSAAQHSVAGGSPAGSPCHPSAARRIGEGRDGWQAALFGKELTTYADPHFNFSQNFIKC